jgi:hypothetical protein
MERPGEEPQRAEEPDDGILAEAVELDAEESSDEQEPPTEDHYVPV